MGWPGCLPHRYEAGKHQLEKAFGVEVVEMPHTLADPDLLSANPAARVVDLHAAFTDPDIAGVVSTIGGDHLIRLLPLLDIDLLAAKPKVFLGSDATITQMALRRAGVVSFYGPAVMTGFGENGGLRDYVIEGVRGTLFDPPDDGVLVWPEYTDGWTVEELDWADPATQQRRRRMHPSTGWRWHGGQVGEGPTVVACLEVLDWLRGTAWWPDLDSAVLLVETSEEAPSPDVVAQFLRSLALRGELQALAGLVLGRPGGAELDPAVHPDYNDALLRVVRTEQGLDHLPVVTGVDFGHSDPMWTIPQGVRLRVDPDAGQLTFVERGVV